MQHLKILDMKATKVSGESFDMLVYAYERNLTLSYFWLSDSLFCAKNFDSLNLVRIADFSPEKKISSLKFRFLFFFFQTKFPASVIPMIHLRSLILSNNKLTELPLKISELQELRELNVSDNLLSYLPHTLSQLKELR